MATTDDDHDCLIHGDSPHVGNGMQDYVIVNGMSLTRGREKGSPKWNWCVSVGLASAPANDQARKPDSPGALERVMASR
jgi:hypothetical protein